MPSFLAMLMKTKVYKWVLKTVIPFVEIPGYRKIRGVKYHEGYDLLKPGHIILTINDGKPFTKLYKGWKHAALCVGKGEYPEVLEMTSHDFTESHFYDICAESSRVCIIECVDFSDGYIIQMIEKAKSFKGAKYDAEFDLGIEALYCSELIYQADFKRLLQLDLSDLLGMGRQYISPQGLYEAKNARVLWDSEMS